MKIAVVGAGGIGGFVGARLALAGEDVTFIARGANVAAIREHGLRLVAQDGTESVAKAMATDDYAAAGPQDLVVVAVKAHQLASVAPSMHALYGPKTAVITMQNGIPYWYFHRHGGELAGTELRSVDPDGVVGRHLSPERVIGCVVYPACELVAPGVVHHVEGDRFPLGELDGSVTPRVTQASEAFVRAGLKAPVLDDIRAEMWLKLWGNLTFNPISALTRSTLAAICRDPLTRDLARAMMLEAQAVAGALGITFRVAVDKRIAGAERVGEHKTSMLQDVEAGREPEIEALVGSVIELARLTSTPTPHIDAVYALTQRLAATLPGASKAAASAPASPPGPSARAGVLAA